MDKKSLLTKVLAVAGTGLMWFPILATVFISVIGSIQANVFRFDYLMPAELFPAALLGGGLLIWAAMRARSHVKLIGWGFAGLVVSLFGSQALAVVTGLASGEAELAGWPWVLVVVLLAAYSIMLVVVGIAGILLVRDLLRHGKEIGRHPHNS